MYFMPVDIRDNHEIDRQTNKSKYVIDMYGIMRNGSKILLTLTDVPVYFDIRLPFW